MKVIEGGVTAAQGFEAAGVEASIKYQNRKDMALVYSRKPCVAAGVFTSNIVKAAPVIWDKEVVAHSPYAQAVIANAGIANACTGSQGYECCKQTAKAAAEYLQIPEDAVLVASTGVIGRQIPTDKIMEGVKKLVEQKADTIEAGRIAAEAIMTTDIAISKELLQEALRENVTDTFNMISVDGDTSTNDTLVILANGMAGNPEITSKNEDYEKFMEALNQVNTTLAKMMAGDGEGATALFETKVIHAKTKEDARKLSKSVISSSLSKAAVFGHDANCGRFLCALGYAGVDFDPDRLDVFLESEGRSILVYRDGNVTDYSEEEATQILSAPEVRVLVDVKEGDGEATAWGCDLTYDYVKINADYRS